MNRPLLMLLAGLAAGCPAHAPPQAPEPPQAPGPRRTATASDIVFLIVSEAKRVALVPLGCVVEGQVTGGPACLAAPPDSVPVATGDRPLPLIGRGQVACPAASGRVAPALVARAPAPAPDGLAAWPATAARRIWPVRAGSPWEPSGCRGWCSFERTGHPRVNLTADRRRWIAEAVTRAAGDDPGKALQVLQELAVDLDGDGTPERLYSVAVIDRAADGYAFLFSGLFLERGGELALLRREDDDAIVVRGTLDVDGDGMRELWLLHSPTAGPGEANVLLSPATGEIGAYDCRPDR